MAPEIPDITRTGIVEKAEHTGAPAPQQKTVSNLLAIFEGCDFGGEVGDRLFRRRRRLVLASENTM